MRVSQAAGVTAPDDSPSEGSVGLVIRDANLSFEAQVALVWYDVQSGPWFVPDRFA